MPLIRGNKVAADSVEPDAKSAETADEHWNLLDHIPGNARQRLLGVLIAVLATIFLTTFTLYAVASWTSLLPPGAQGAQGPTGEKGERGPRGGRGKDGKDGRNGTDGEDGEDGQDACELDPSELQYPDLLYRFC